MNDPQMIQVPEYSVTCNGEPVALETLFELRNWGRHEVFPIHTALVEAGDHSRIRILATGRHDTPWRMQRFERMEWQEGISGKIECEFTANEAGVFVLDQTRTAPLILRIVAPQTLPSGHDVRSLAEWSIDPHPQRDQTHGIQHAIDACARETPGGTLLIPPGIYCLGTLRLPSNLTVHLARGARLQAVDTPEAFPLDPENDYPVSPEIPKNLERDARGRFIYMEGCENTHLTGQGTIDGAGYVLREVEAPNINGIRMDRCCNCSISGITLQNTRFWALHVYRSEHIRIENVTILNPNLFTSDGIDIDSSRHVKVRRAFIHSGDDTLVVKHTAMKRGHAFAPRDIHFRECFLLSGCTAMKLGSESLTDFFEHISFQHIRIGNLATVTGRAMAIELKDHAHMRDITWEDIRAGDVNRLIDCSVLPRNDQSSRFGHISDIILKNISAGKTVDPPRFYGRDAHHRLERIHLEKLSIDGKALSEASLGEIEINEFAHVTILG